jgi:hypothetical protein
VITDITGQRKVMLKGWWFGTGVEGMVVRGDSHVNDSF